MHTLHILFYLVSHSCVFASRCDGRGAWCRCYRGFLQHDPVMGAASSGQSMVLWSLTFLIPLLTIGL